MRSNPAYRKIDSALDHLDIALGYLEDAQTDSTGELDEVMKLSIVKTEELKQWLKKSVDEAPESL